VFDGDKITTNKKARYLYRFKYHSKPSNVTSSSTSEMDQSDVSITATGGPCPGADTSSISSSVNPASPIDELHQVIFPFEEDPMLLDPDERAKIDNSLMKEDKFIIEDLVSSAINNANKKVDIEINNKMLNMMHEMGIPNNFISMIPFINSK
jgi:hypothetical protein